MRIKLKLLKRKSKNFGKILGKFWENFGDSKAIKMCDNIYYKHAIFKVKEWMI